MYRMATKIDRNNSVECSDTGIVEVYLSRPLWGFSIIQFVPLKSNNGDEERPQ